MEPLESAISKLSKQGFCCSQILAILILSAQGKENNGLVRSLAGLCHGIGQSGNACGILTGGSCVLTYLVWEQQEGITTLPDFAKIVLEEYTDWFEDVTSKRYGSINCKDILNEDDPNGPDRTRCRQLLAESWIRLLGILTVHNIAFAKAKQ